MYKTMSDEFLVYVFEIKNYKHLQLFIYILLRFLLISYCRETQNNSSSSDAWSRKAKTLDGHRLLQISMLPLRHANSLTFNEPPTNKKSDQTISESVTLTFIRSIPLRKFADRSAFSARSPAFLIFPRVTCV